MEQDERLWRVHGWEEGYEDEPHVSVEFEDGSKDYLSLSGMYGNFDEMEEIEDPYLYLPDLWKKLFQESLEDCVAYFGEEEYYRFTYHNPCRWRPHAELDALYEHAKHNLLVLKEP